MLRKHKRLTKKELKKDPFVIFTARLLDYVQDEWIKIAAIVFTVALVGFLAYFIFQGRKKSEINAYDAALTALQNNAPEASSLLKELVDKYGRSQRTADVLILLGNLSFQKKDFESSEKYYSQYIDKFSGNPLSDFNVFSALGVVYEEKGEHIKAAKIYKRFLSKHKDSPFTSMMCMYTGKAYWHAGDKKEAKNYFNKVADDPYDSQDKLEALYYLELLNLNQLDELNNN